MADLAKRSPGKPHVAELQAVARCLAQLDGKFIGASQWRGGIQAEYEERARRVLRTIENVKAGNGSGGLP